jgi:hypothetical protein
MIGSTKKAGLRYCPVCNVQTSETSCPKHNAPTIETPARVTQGPSGTTILDHGFACVVVMPDVINERFDGAALGEELQDARAIVFDLDRVELVTSYGIRQWIRMIGSLPPEPYYCFIRGRPAAVAQFNLVPGFAGRGELLSIFVPYSCPRCSGTSELLVDVEADKDLLDSMSAPPIQCARCRVDAELEDVPEVYFTFVANAPRPSPPGPVAALITGSPSGARANRSKGTTLSVAKEIGDDRTTFRLTGVLHEGASFDPLGDGVSGLVEVDLAGTTGIDKAGGDRLLDFLIRMGCEVRLARARLSLVEELLESPLSAKVSLTSLEGVTECGRCGKTHNVALPASERQLRCCGEDLPHVRVLSSRLSR